MSAIVVFSVLAQMYFPDTERYKLSLLGNAQYFLAGFLLCEFYFATSPLRAAGYLLDATAMIVLLPLLYSDNLVVEVLFPFGALLVFFGGLRGMLLPRLFGLTIISVSGGMCYSLYLTHGTVLATLGTLWRKVSLGSLPLLTQQLLMIGVCTVTVFATGAAYFVLIERPCMDPHWHRKLAGRLRRIGRSVRHSDEATHLEMVRLVAPLQPSVPLISPPATPPAFGVPARLEKPLRPDLVNPPTGGGRSVSLP